MAAPSIARGAPVTVTHHVRTIRSNWLRTRLRLGRSTAFNFAALTAGTALIVFVVLMLPSAFAAALLVVPLLLGSWVLPMRWLLALAGVIALARFVVFSLRTEPFGLATAGAYLIVIAIVLLGARARSARRPGNAR